jgi:vitamin B12 transporter
MLRAILLFLLLVSTLLVPAYCQTGSEPDTSKIFRMSEIVVSATRTPRQSLEVASSVSVIDSEEISQSNGAGMVDLLRGQYGLAISQSGGPGQLSQLYMRGCAPDNVLVEIDGVRLNMPDDPGNAYDFSFLSTDNIERVEILRGPQSTLYGSDAIGGVIQVFTKRGSAGHKFLVDLEGGSLNSYKGRFGVQGASGPLDYSVVLSRTRSDGISNADQAFGNTERDGFQDYIVSSTLGWAPATDARVNIMATFNSGKLGLDQHAGLFGDDQTYNYNHQQGAYSATLSLSPFAGWQHQVVVSFMRNLRTYSFDSTLFNPASSRSSYQGSAYQIELQNNVTSLPFQLVTFGLEGYGESATSDNVYTSSVYGDFTSHFPRTRLTAFSTYVQDQITLPDAYFATVGARYDHHGDIGSSFTYRLAFAHLIEQSGTKLRAVVGTGFKAPSLFNLNDPVYGNPGLTSERSFGWEAGIEQYLRNEGAMRLSLGVTYFHTTFSDMFGYNENFRAINIGETETSGIETYLTMGLGALKSLNVNYTYTHAVDRTSGSPEEGMELIRRPGHTASLRFTTAPVSDLQLHCGIEYVGERDDYDFSSFPARRARLGSYILVHVSSSLQLSEYLRVYGRIENVTDKVYEEVFGYGTVGRAGYVGFNLTLL